MLPALLLLAACHSLPPPRNAQQHYTGRFTLVVTRAQPDAAPRREGWTGRFALAVAPEELTLDLLSPLGSTLARIQTDAQEARLLVPGDGGMHVERGADAQALAERVLGWSLPVLGIADWIEGRPAPGRPYQVLPPVADGRHFSQDGWTVTVETDAGAGPLRRMQMDRPSHDGLPAVALRIVLDVSAG